MNKEGSMRITLIKLRDEAQIGFGSARMEFAFGTQLYIIAM